MVESTAAQSRIDGYTCIKTLGEGASGTVKYCKDAKGRGYAIKIFHNLRTVKSTQDVARGEQKALNWNKHPNIIKLIDCQLNGTWYKKDGETV